MKRFFDLAAQRHEEIVKEAIAGAVIGAAKNIAMPAISFMVKNPLKTLGAALTASEVAGGAKNVSQAAMSSKMAPQALQTVRQTF